jgi:signal transduction histidine kinase
MPDTRKSSPVLSPDLAASMVEGNTIGVLVFDADQDLLYASPKARALLPDMRHGDGALAIAQIAALAHDAPGDFHVGDRWLRATLQPAADGGAIVVLTEITDLKQTEMTLSDARDMARMADRKKSEFLANMTHELRTPLNAVIGFAEVLRDELYGPLGHEFYRDFVVDIHESGRHLLAVIDDILDLSKIEISSRKFKPREIDISHTIDAAVRMIKQRADDAGIMLHVQLDTNLHNLSGEEHGIRQILLNLLSSAVKFTPRGGSVTVHAAQEPDGGLSLAVSDTGIGIEAADLQRIFTPFVQLETAELADGAGLGLPLVKSLAEMHSAIVSIESTFGEGTTISVHFPASAMLPIPSQPGG